MALDQNSDRALRYLLAEEYFKTASARWGALRLSCAFLVAAASPIAYRYGTVGRATLGFLGGATVVLALLSERLEEAARRRGAETKEVFDTEVLGIPWNDGLVSRTVTEEEIVAAARRMRRRLDEFKDWYPNIAQLPPGLGALLRQRSSLVWDARLRSRYALTSLAIGVTFLIASLAVGLLNDMELLSYILVWLLPGLSLMGGSLLGFIRHSETARGRRRVADIAESQWAGALRDGRDIGTTELRGLQDAVYRFRSATPVVPRRFARFLVARLDDDMRIASEEMRQRAVGLLP